MTTETKSVLLLFRDRSPVYRDCFHQFVRAARYYDYEAIALAPTGTRFSPGEVDHYYYCENYDDADLLRSQVRDICARHAIRRLFVSFEGDVFPAALCREENHMKGLSAQHCIYFRDKNAMSARARELGVRTPEGCLPHTSGTLEAFVERVGYPIVLKPYNGMSAKNSYKVNSAEEMEQVWHEIRNDRHNYRAENFIKGKQFHLDSLVQNGEVVLEVLSEYTYCLLDSLIDRYRSAEVVASITRCFNLSEPHRQMLEYNRRILKGFGMKVGVAHAEFFLTDEGVVYFGEVGARVGGVYIVPMIEEACGVHLAAEWARMELDPTHYPSPRNSIECGGALILSPARGRIVSMSRAEDLLEHGSVVAAQMWMSPGDVLRDAVHSAEALGFYICSGATYDDVLNNLIQIGKHFQLQTEPLTPQ
jgi:biotin carboxylase